MAKEIWAFNNKEFDWIKSKVDLEPAPLRYSAVIPSFAISAALTCALTEFKKLSDDKRFDQALVTPVKLFFIALSRSNLCLTLILWFLSSVANFFPPE